MFAGSVLDLEPGTAYEIQLVLSDADGVIGESRRVVSVRPRAEPIPFKGGRTFHVYPHGFKGSKTESETAAAATSNSHWRNNLMLGENARPVIFAVTTFTNYTSSDHNGFRPNPGAQTSFEWTSPPSSVITDFTGPGRTAQLETRRFASLAEYAKATGQDTHSVLVDYDVFMKVPKLDAHDAASVQRLYDARDLDFRLRSGSAAVDRGVALPTITDGFAGRSPDLGALEAGAPVPTYGPRQVPRR